MLAHSAPICYISALAKHCSRPLANISKQGRPKSMPSQVLPSVISLPLWQTVHKENLGLGPSSRSGKRQSCSHSSTGSQAPLRVQRGQAGTELGVLQSNLPQGRASPLSRAPSAVALEGSGQEDLGRRCVVTAAHQHWAGRGTSRLWDPQTLFQGVQWGWRFCVSRQGLRVYHYHHIIYTHKLIMPRGTSRL